VRRSSSASSTTVPNHARTSWGKLILVALIGWLVILAHLPWAPPPGPDPVNALYGPDPATANTDFLDTLSRVKNDSGHPVEQDLLPPPALKPSP
jgi:hypothetical protein